MRIKFIQIFLSTLAVPSFAQVAVPVQDIQHEIAETARHQELRIMLGDSSTQISAQITNSTKALTMQQDEMNRQAAERMASQYMAVEKRRNAERHSVMFGAKVKDGCAMTKAAAQVQGGNLAKKKIFNQSVSVADRYIERGKHKSPGEPATIGEASSILSKFARINMFEREKLGEDPKASMIESGLSYSTTQNAEGLSEYRVNLERKMVLINPFADALPENYDSPSQPAAQLSKSAHAKWKNEMLKEIAKNQIYILANKATTFSDEWAKSLFAASSEGVEMKKLALDDTQKKGYYATLEILNKARMFHPDWHAYTNVGMTERALAADANMMAAQNLVNQSEIIRLLVMLNENMHLALANDMAHYWKNDITSTTPQ